MVDPEKVFHISPKTSWEWLANQPNIRSSPVLNKVADDILLNAQEVVATVNWDEFLYQLSQTSNGINSKRFGALVNAPYTSTIASMACRGRWNLEDPQMVAASVYSMAAYARRNARLIDYQATIDKALLPYIVQCLPGGQVEFTALIKILQFPNRETSHRQTAIDLLKVGRYIQARSVMVTF